MAKAPTAKSPPPPDLVAPAPAAPPPSNEEASKLDPELIRAQLEADYQKEMTRLNELLAGFERWKLAATVGNSLVISTEDAAAKATTFCAQLKTLSKTAETKRKVEKEPYDNAGKVVQSFFKVGMIDRLDTAAGIIERTLTAYANAKAAKAREEAAALAKAQREEADRLADLARKTENSVMMEHSAAVHAEADASDKVATSTNATLGQTRGVLGGVSSLRQRWDYEVTDKAALIAAVAAGTLSVDLLDINPSTIRAMIQSGTRELPGVRIFDDSKVSVRT